LGLRALIAEVLGHLGTVALEQGDWRRAAATHTESLNLSRELGDRPEIAYDLEGLARVAAVSANPAGDPRRGALLLSAAAALRAIIGAPLPPVEAEPVERALEEVRAALGEQAFAAAWAEGQVLPMDEAITLALEMVQVEEGA
jgi:hypothetical protein